MSRLDLQEALEKIGCPVHYQPPSSIHLTYPCIIYELDGINSIFADNKVYIGHSKFNVTYITKDADSHIPKQIVDLVKYGSIKRQFKQDNLYHTVISCQELY